jgi:hypothetical protein
MVFVEESDKRVGAGFEMRFIPTFLRIVYEPGMPAESLPRWEFKSPSGMRKMIRILVTMR